MNLGPIASKQSYLVDLNLVKAATSFLTFHEPLSAEFRYRIRTRWTRWDRDNFLSIKFLPNINVLSWKADQSSYTRRRCIAKDSSRQYVSNRSIFNLLIRKVVLHIILKLITHLLWGAAPRSRCIVTFVSYIGVLFIRRLFIGTIIYRLINDNEISLTESTCQNANLCYTNEKW